VLTVKINMLDEESNGKSFTLAVRGFNAASSAPRRVSKCGVGAASLKDKKAFDRGYSGIVKAVDNGAPMEACNTKSD
jgi:hypothetical protein